MNGSTDSTASATDQAAHQLAALQKQVGQTRVLLAGLQHQVFKAEQHRDRQAHLVEAYEPLLVSTLRAQGEAETAASELEELSRSAEVDALTGLPSRALLLDRLEYALTMAKRHGNRLALLFVDIEGFEQVNDSLGHATGDEVLSLAAKSLVASVREGDTVSRHGGHEFLILLEEVTHPPDAMLVAGKLIAALHGPHHVGQQTLRLKANIGMSLYPDHGHDAGTLIDRADAAMHRAKRRGRGSFAVHGENPENGDVPPSSPESPQNTASHQQLVLDEHESWHAQQRQAHEQMADGHQRALAAHEHQHTLQREANTQLVSGHQLAEAEHVRQHARQQEANEHLLLAALDAQQLQCDAELARRRQTEFLAMIAHELRNPLAPISNAAALLGMLPTEELLPRLQAIIERQVVHMSRLVSDLLDVSRANTGKLRLERVPTDLGGIIEQAADACRPTMDARRQRFDVRLLARVLEVNGDPVRLTQVFSNLFDNASKYTPVGGEIELSVAVVDDAVVTTVSDNGIGISADALPHVFAPFAQDAQAIGFNGFGLGIGLTVVRELVEAHGGHVVARSAGSGQGSRFEVTLPLAEGA